MKANLQWSDEDKDKTSGPELNFQLKGAEEMNVGIDAIIFGLYLKDLSDYLALK